MPNRIALLAAVCLACHSSRDDTQVRDSTVVTTVPVGDITSGVSDSASQSGKKPACEPTGRWAKCSVEKRLESAGFVPIPAQAAMKRAGFSVDPIAYTLGHARLEVFLYPDERALARDVARLDTTTVAPAGASNSWEVPPIFVRSANLAAVFLSDNPRQAERLTLALTAGAPQPRGVQTLKPSISTPSSPR